MEIVPQSCIVNVSDYIPSLINILYNYLKIIKKKIIFIWNGCGNCWEFKSGNVSFWHNSVFCRMVLCLRKQHFDSNYYFRGIMPHHDHFPENWGLLAIECLNSVVQQDMLIQSIIFFYFIFQLNIFYLPYKKTK